MVISSRTGTVISGLYPGNHFEIARHQDGMLLMRIDRLTSQMAQDSECYRLSRLTTTSEKPRPAIYDEEGQLVRGNWLTNQSKWDRPGIESDSDTEYTRYMRNDEVRFDPVTEKELTFMEMRALYQTTKEYKTRRQLKEYWKQLTPISNLSLIHI